ncbi:MAG: FIG01310822: Short chain dehydrogenase [uncultured Rubrobacteraceae bacterium]|uniref:FIG01310822: Short chain dehydrogenase n=1 Tax=uncultured Rubrobacteraceae bacterium TaxID=349277 RepID=A0A6J4R998_9ACTN|nr:MAG: FIG01310822: Short chain dehydrogenase [uncultured Rubrobacteraceae bacterium]
MSDARSRPAAGLAVVTGASSGIGAATARALAGAGFTVALGARREERIEKLAGEIGGHAKMLDVTDRGSVEEFASWVESLGGAAVLVNNAGGARGLEQVAELDEEHWRWMFETNVLGVGLVTKALLPQLRASGRGHIVVMGSAAGVEAYPGGAGYNAAKFGAHAITHNLRLELLGEDVRVTEVLPGAVRTEEFGLVRFEGDEEKAEAVYRGITPLTAEDIAECVRWAVSLPPHVNIDRIDVKPIRQGGAALFARDA